MTDRKRPPSLRIVRREFIASAAAVGSAFLIDGHARARPAHDEHAASADDLPEGKGLSPQEWSALELAVQIMLPADLPKDGPSVAEVVANLERFLSNADETTFAELRLQLRTLGAIAPLAARHIPSLKRFALTQLRSRGYSAVKTALDSLHKVAVLGYYSHRKTYERLAYEPTKIDALHKTSLRVLARPTDRVFDVAIVGSGVAGSLLAERLSAAGKSVLILESGPYVREMDIDSDELRWIARLERGSGLQQANAAEPYVRSARPFPILQGHCVGGGGMINNAVCFQLPAQRVAQWQGVGFPVPAAALRAGYVATAAELGIQTVSKAMEKDAFLNPSLLYLHNDLFGELKVPSISEPPTPGFYECLVNLDRCLGCGLCNTGCGSERKRNALQVHLPSALSCGRDTELVANAIVEEVVLARRVAGAPGRVAGLRVRSRNAGVGAFTVRARQYVLSAGAIHTPALLLRSPDVCDQAVTLPMIGERLSAHVTSPVLGFMEDIVHPRPGLQLTHYYIPPNPDDGFMIENLYNPPGQSALVMAGYGDKHFARMQRYKRTLLVGAVVPTLPNGRIRIGADGRNVITQPLADNELDRLRTALALTARAMLRGSKEHGRPYEVIVGSGGGGYVMSTENDVPRFERWLRSFDQLALSTGHPQGGCAMSEDERIGVVDSNFRLRGFANLRVCDASLFPMSATVNPQWTVMALAHHCATVMNATAD